jgi:hypothetical protein
MVSGMKSVRETGHSHRLRPGEACAAAPSSGTGRLWASYCSGVSSASPLAGPGPALRKTLSCAAVGRAQARREDQGPPDGGTAQSNGYTPAMTHLRNDEYGQSAARDAWPCLTGL